MASPSSPRSKAAFMRCKRSCRLRLISIAVSRRPAKLLIVFFSSRSTLVSRSHFSPVFRPGSVFLLPPPSHVLPYCFSNPSDVFPFELAAVEAIAYSVPTPEHHWPLIGVLKRSPLTRSANSTQPTGRNRGPDLSRKVIVLGPCMPLPDYSLDHPLRGSELDRQPSDGPCLLSFRSDHFQFRF